MNCYIITFVGSEKGHVITTDAVLDIAFLEKHRWVHTYELGWVNFENVCAIEKFVDVRDRK